MFSCCLTFYELQYNDFLLPNDIVEQYIFVELILSSLSLTNLNRETSPLAIS
jgi:hypothetical protein